MRLSEDEIVSIKSVFSDKMNNYELRLFGSRVDDKAKGGDIDLLLLTKNKIDLPLKWSLLRSIIEKIGEQKIDLVNFRFNEKDNFKDMIMRDSVKI